MREVGRVEGADDDAHRKTEGPERRGHGGQRTRRQELQRRGETARRVREALGAERRALLRREAGLRREDRELLPRVHERRHPVRAQRLGALGVGRRAGGSLGRAGEPRVRTDDEERSHALGDERRQRERDAAPHGVADQVGPFLRDRGRELVQGVLGARQPDAPGLEPVPGRRSPTTSPR